MARQLNGDLARSTVYVISAATALFFASTDTFRHQDTMALMTLDGSAAPRWAGYIRSAPHGSALAPTFTYDSDRAERERAPQVAFGTSGNGQEKIVAAAAMPDRAALLGGPAGPNAVRVNRIAKGDRLMTIRPSTRRGGFAVGSVFEMDTPLRSTGTAGLPRLAFVKPADPDVPAGATGAYDEFSPPVGARPVPVEVLAARMRAHERLIRVPNTAAGVSLASAYAPDHGLGFLAPFNALFGSEQNEDAAVAALAPGREDPDAPRPIRKRSRFHSWFSKDLPPSVKTLRQRRCLAQAIYFEARSEPWAGQVAVGQVILNRVKNPQYPATICGVVYQNMKMRNRCQFSFACDGKLERIGDQDSWKVAQRIAREIIEGKHLLPEVGDSTHYHATYVRPPWAPRMTRKGKIGQHIFFRTKGGGWT